MIVHSIHKTLPSIPPLVQACLPTKLYTIADTVFMATEKCAQTQYLYFHLLLSSYGKSILPASFTAGYRWTIWTQPTFNQVKAPTCI